MLPQKTLLLTTVGVCERFCGDVPGLPPYMSILVNCCPISPEYYMQAYVHVHVCASSQPAELP